MKQVESITQIPVTAITAGMNDRKRFDKTGLDNLAESMNKIGLGQPIIVRPRPGLVAQYELIAGERRTRAARQLGWATIPAMIRRDLTDEQASSLMLAENTGRVNLDVIEEATGYKIRMDQFQWTVADCAKAAGVSEQLVTERVRLLGLCDAVLELVKSGNFTVGYANILARAGLDRNFQMRAMDLFNANTSPTIIWFRAQVGKLLEAQSQTGMNFGEMWGPAGAVIAESGILDKLPDPERDDAPVPLDIPKLADLVAYQMKWWQDAATGYTTRGDVTRAKKCQACARSLRSLHTTFTKYGA